MKKIFHAHPQIVIATLAVVFLAVLVVCYMWATNVIYAEVHQALTSSLPQSSDAFDLTDAARLDLRGVSGAASGTAAGTARTIATSSGSLSAPAGASSDTAPTAPLPAPKAAGTRG